MATNYSCAQKYRAKKKMKEIFSHSAELMEEEEKKERRIFLRYLNIEPFKAIISCLFRQILSKISEEKKWLFIWKIKIKSIFDLFENNWNS